MMKWPEPNPRQFKEEERKRDLNLSLRDTSDTSQSKGLSRRAFVLLQLTVLLLIIVGIVVWIHIFH